MDLTAHTDGASRGNPGPAAFGYTIEKDGVVIEEYSEYIGKATNNIAEYKAFIAAAKKMKVLGGTRITIFSDSELAVRQINGQYRVKNAGLQPLHTEIMDLACQFQSFKVIHVRREMNSQSDKLANIALDEH
ncbi:MAG: ribonuclease HI family protein [Candidatus Latescibacter sp.]|nr:ribonuclease HI family protein [Candidatus Latescibacter sp.]